jgi:hypothetical protein
LWKGAGAADNKYEVEVFFTEAVKDYDPSDPNDDPSNFFRIWNLGVAVNEIEWLDPDGSDSVLNLMITTSGPVGTPPNAKIRIGWDPAWGGIEDLADPANETYSLVKDLEGFTTKPDYWLYPEIPPFSGPDGGPLLSDSTMDLHGFIYDPNGLPATPGYCRGEIEDVLCEHGPCGPVVMAFKYENLFDCDPNSDTYGQILIDPAKCSGATQVRRCDGYYAMHIYGQKCAGCDEGEAIILVVLLRHYRLEPEDWPIQVSDPEYINQIYIMTGLIPDNGFYLEWDDSRNGGPETLNIYLAKQEKIYLRPGWSLMATTVDKSYYDEDGTPYTGIDQFNQPIVTAGTALLNSNDQPTRDLVPMNDIEKVFFTISPPCGGGWTRCCTYDPVHYINGGFVVDYASYYPNAPTENQIAFFNPGNAYFIHMDTDGLLVVLGDLLSSRKNQPYTRELVSDQNGEWNLVGYFSNVLRITLSGPNPAIFDPGDFSSAYDGEVKFNYFEADDFFMGANANHLRTLVNIEPGNPVLSGMKVWVPGTSDFRFIGPSMGAWVNAESSPVQFDED